MLSMNNHQAVAFPSLARRVPRVVLADLPTPLVERRLHTRHGKCDIAIKCDDVSASLYGGNKVRKLEYLLCRAQQRHARRIATFGTVASNHAIATALFARQLGFDCTCFLLHQTRTPNAATALKVHLENGTEIVRYGGSGAECRRLLRKHLWHRDAWLIPAGGSNWLGAVGFVNAGLELAAQLADGGAPPPDRLYVANGTMATAVGIALGLSLAGLPTTVEAVQVTEDFVSSPAAMRRLMVKTAALLHRLDASIPDDLAARARCSFRSGFLGDGYAKTNPVVDRAVAVARDELGLELETTYTGKALAAMLHDLEQPQSAGKSVLFWNTYNSRPLSVASAPLGDTAQLPEEFLRYFDPL